MSVELAAERRHEKAPGASPGDGILESKNREAVTEGRSLFEAASCPRVATDDPLTAEQPRTSVRGSCIVAPRVYRNRRPDTAVALRDLSTGVD